MRFVVCPFSNRTDTLPKPRAEAREDAKSAGERPEGLSIAPRRVLGIRGVESLVEQDDTVVVVEHQIAGVDCAGLVCGGGKRGGQVMVFLIAVQFVHRDGIGLS